MSEYFDIVVVGSGPGGYVAAIRAAQIGMRTAIVEKDQVGGRCLHLACIPAKTVLRSADLLSEVLGAQEFGVEVENFRVDFPTVGKRRDEVIKTLGSGVQGLLKKNKVEVVLGQGGLNADGSVVVGDRTLHASSAVILATGSVRYPVPGVAFGGRVIGTEEAWAFDQLPASLAVVGAGASGAEIASAYARLGTKVQLFELLDQVLPQEDADVSEAVRQSFKQQGIEVHTSTAVENVDPQEGKVSFTFDDSRGEAAWLVIATGRRPDLAGLGIDQAGVRLISGFIEVDDHLRTSVPGIYAIGDLVPGPALAHKASEEGIVAVETAAGYKVAGLSYQDIPRVTFSSPNVGSFGFTEAAARALGYDVVVGEAPYRSVGAGTIYGEKTGFVKLVGDRQYGSILGAHVVGLRAPELIQQLANVAELEGGYPELARIVHGHPTLSEVLLEAARDADGWLIHG